MNNIPILLSYGNFIETELVNLSYSTATITSNAARTMTATPDPDPTGNTGYASVSGTRGLTISTNIAFTATITDNTYPSYSVTTVLRPEYIGTHSGFMDVSIRDFEGTLGISSGSIPISLTRNFVWDALTTFSPNVSANQRFMMFLDSLDRLQFRVYNGSDGTYSTVIQGNRSFHNNFTAGVCYPHNEIMFEHVSGATGWYVTDIDNLSSATKTKGVYHDMAGIVLMSDSNPSASSTVTSVIRITFRNKRDNSETFVQQITVNVVRS